MDAKEYKKAKDAAHVARVIQDRKNGFEPNSGSMTDEIVTGSFKRNRDGSLTIACQISVTDHMTGEYWCLDTRKIRLPKR